MIDTFYFLIFLTKFLETLKSREFQRQAAQCVGRVIRSKADYGMMIFADKRYFDYCLDLFNFGLAEHGESHMYGCFMLTNWLQSCCISYALNCQSHVAKKGSHFPAFGHVIQWKQAFLVQNSLLKCQQKGTILGKHMMHEVGSFNEKVYT